MLRVAWKAGLCVLTTCLLASCLRAGQGSQSDRDDGTCYGACDHYLGCKGDEREESRDTCLSECREIFVTNGQPDRQSLRMFEDLECDAAVAFVDGEPAAQRSAANEQDGTAPGALTPRGPAQ
jgi:hypothetical protein